MTLLLTLIPVALIVATFGWLRVRVSKVRRTELSHVEFAVNELDELFHIRRDHLPEIISVCRVFTDYERGTLTRLTELHASLMKAPPVAERIVLENAVSEFLRDLVNTIGEHPELEANVFLKQHLAKVYRAEERIADRRSRVNQRVDEFNDAIQSGVLGKVGKSFGLLPLRRLDMTAQELLKATSPFGSGVTSAVRTDAQAALEESPVASAPADEFGDDSFDLSDEVDEFGGDPEDIPKLTSTRAPAEDADELRMVEVDDDDF